MKTIKLQNTDFISHAAGIWKICLSPNRVTVTDDEGQSAYFEPLVSDLNGVSGLSNNGVEVPVRREYSKIEETHGAYYDPTDFMLYARREDRGPMIGDIQLSYY